MGGRGGGGGTDPFSMLVLLLTDITAVETMSASDTLTKPSTSSTSSILPPQLPFASQFVFLTDFSPGIQIITFCTFIFTYQPDSKDVHFTLLSYNLFINLFSVCRFSWLRHKWVIHRDLNR